MLYRPEIDGLRAVAVMSVILYHAGFEIFSGGYVGVDIFFVISGYLISKIIFHDLDRNIFSLKQFYKRRARRILPALILVLFVSVIVAWFILLPDEIKSFSENLISVNVFASNFLYRKAGYFDSPTEYNPLIHTWSLSLEEQFYIFFPIFSVVFFKYGYRRIIIVLITIFLLSLAYAQILASKSPVANFYMLTTRAWELLIGVFITLIFDKIKCINTRNINELFAILGFFFIIFSIFSFDEKTPFPSFWTLFPTVGTALIILFGDHKTFVGKILTFKIFLNLGLISYSAYLWHQPLFAYMKLFSLNKPSISTMGLLASLSILMAYLSYKFIELPFRYKKVNEKIMYYSFALIMLIFIMIGLIGMQGRIKTFWEVKNPGLSNVTDIKGNLNYINCSSDFAKIGNADCKVVGNGQNKVVIWGDSHAGVMSKVIPEIEGTKIYVISHSGCPPIIGVRRFDKVDKISSCANTKSLESYSKFIAEIKPSTVILVGRWSLYLNGYYIDGIPQKNHHYLSLDDKDNSIKTLKLRESNLIQQLDKTVNYFANNSRVIILTQPPEYSFLNARAIKNTNFSLSTSNLSVWHNSEYDLFAGLKKSLNLKILDSKKLFCDSEKCNTRNNGQLLYADDNHLSYDGAIKIWGIILPEIHAK
jgi:peptidoglycan/LPS O-acetylase OafA/YrhL